MRGVQIDSNNEMSSVHVSRTRSHVQITTEYWITSSNRVSHRCCQESCVPSRLPWTFTNACIDILRISSLFLKNPPWTKQEALQWVNLFWKNFIDEAMLAWLPFVSSSCFYSSISVAKELYPIWHDSCHLSSLVSVLYRQVSISYIKNRNHPKGFSFTVDLNTISSTQKFAVFFLCSA